MYHNFFIYSSVDEHLGCFHVLAIVNCVAMNIRIHVSFSIIISSGTKQGCPLSLLLFNHFFFKKPLAHFFVTSCGTSTM